MTLRVLFTNIIYFNFLLVQCFSSILWLNFRIFLSFVRHFSIQIGSLCRIPINRSPTNLSAKSDIQSELHRSCAFTKIHVLVYTSDAQDPNAFHEIILIVRTVVGVAKKFHNPQFTKNLKTQGTIQNPPKIIYDGQYLSFDPHPSLCCHDKTIN